MFEQDWYGFTGRLDVQQAPAPYPAAPDYAMLPRSDWRNTPEKRAVRKRDGQRKQRAAETTHCPSGHLYDAANTGVRATGQRWCRVCARDRERVRRVNRRRSQ